MTGAEVSHSLEQVLEKTLSNPMTRGIMRANASTFWKGQQNVLDSMQELAEAWFARRRVGSQSALDASMCICDAPNPVDAAGE